MIVKNCRLKFGNPTVVDDNNKYSITFLVDDEKEEQKLIEMIEDEWEEAGVGKPKSLSYKTYEPGEGYEDDDDAGRTIFSASQNAENAKGKKFTVRIYDAKGKLIKNVPEIGWGSIFNINTDPYVWTYQKQMGVKLNLNAMQLIKLVQFDSGDAGFDEEDGYVAEEDFTSEGEEKPKKKKKKGKH